MRRVGIALGLAQGLTQRLALGLALASCASLPAPIALDTPAAMANMLIGQYDNAAQFAAAPSLLKRAPAAGYPYDWVDQQRARFTRVAAPLIGPDVVYVEWRRADGTLSRQRIWSFRREPGAGLRMDYFSFKTPQTFAGASVAPGAFATLRPEDLIGYGPACALYLDTRAPHDGWQGAIEAEQCQITGAASGRRMGLSVRLIVQPGGLTYEEAGILPDGAYAFKVPGGVPYVMQRR